VDEIEDLANYCKTVLKLDKAGLGVEYGYNCLPLCVIDAVWSIGVRYTGVQNVVSRYRTHFGLHEDVIQEQYCVRDLVDAMQSQGARWFAEQVFQNAQRTSTRNGILKSEAVYQFASVLHRHNMNRIEDVPNINWYQNLSSEMKKPYAQELLSIPGQSSGISLSYFYMLTGSHGLVKPDRMVYGFLKDVLHRQVSDDDAQRLLSYATRQLNSEFPSLTPRILDHEIWKYKSAEQYAVIQRKP
jgi:hypothetical protein